MSFAPSEGLVGGLLRPRLLKLLIMATMSAFKSKHMRKRYIEQVRKHTCLAHICTSELKHSACCACFHAIFETSSCFLASHADVFKVLYCSLQAQTWDAMRCTPFCCECVSNVHEWKCKDVKGIDLCAQNRKVWGIAPGFHPRGWSCWTVLRR